MNATFFFLFFLILPYLEPNLTQNSHQINSFSYFEENGVHLKEKVVFKIKEIER